MDNTKNSSRSTIWTVVALIVLAVIGWWIYTASTAPSETGSPAGGTVLEGNGIEEGAAGGPIGTSTSTESLPSSAEVVGNAIVITTENYKFTPPTITVNKGDAVTIKLVNNSGFHDLKIDEYAVATKRLSTAGESETITFAADKSGNFEYYCSVGNHRAMGMKGTLIVK